MAGEKEIKQTGTVAASESSGFCTPLIEREVVARKDGISSDKTSTPTHSGVSTSTIKGYKESYDEWLAKSQQYTPNISKKPFLNPHPLKPLCQLSQDLYSRRNLGRGFNPSKGVMRGSQPAGESPSYANRNDQDGYFTHATTPLNKGPSARMWASNDMYDSIEKPNRRGEFEAQQTELIRGPRGQGQNNPLNSLAEDRQMGPSMQRDEYNLKDFRTEYDNAKFYVIKSYSEVDIHKCIKYNVWSSTSTGNKKLDAAFHEAQGKASEAGLECPIFLFYSVNTSGQFVGVAEMVGPVDFVKKMDFWQADKWSGFFPVQWHIIKDIPNPQLKHIILENNDNRPVTFTRDTQEIGLRQGFQMLKIFKSYPAKTSMLDDFNFYENRAQTLKAKRINKPAPQVHA